MKRNRLITLLLCIALLCALLPAAALAAAPTKLVVGSDSIHDLAEDQEGTGWRWSADAQVLTLDGYSGGRIFCNGSLTIELPANTSSSILETEQASAIESAGLLTIAGGGTLSVTERSEEGLYGILGQDGVTVSGAVRLDVDIRSVGTRTAIGIQATNGNLQFQSSAYVTVRTAATSIDADDNPSAFGLYTYCDVRVVDYATLNVITTADGEGSCIEGIRAEQNVFFSDNAIVNISATADGKVSSANGISVWGEIKIDGNASVSTVGTGGFSGYGMIFKTENPYASEDKLSVVVGPEVIHVGFQGSTQAMNTGFPNPKDDITLLEPGNFNWTSDTREPAVSTDQKTAERNITFDPMGGAVSPQSAKTGADGRLAALPTPTREGNFAFDGWFNLEEGGQRITTSSIFTENTLIFAHWREIEADVKQPLCLDLFLKEGDEYSIPQKPYTFMLSGSTREITLYAHAGSRVDGVMLHSITGAQQEVVTPLEAAVDGYLPVTLPADPDNPTMVSVWLSLSGSDDFIDTRSNTLTFFVQKAPVQLLELRFETNGGDSIPTIAQEKDTVISLAEYIPERTDYVFTGWYEDEARTKLVTSVTLTDSRTVYAGWKKAFPFTDVKEDHWFYAGVDYCFQNGLMNGMTETLFSPNDVVTRAQLVTILYRAAGSPEVSFAGIFTDVPGGKWYSNAIEWAAGKGVVTGYGDGVFKPENKITREQIATILYRDAGSPAVTGELAFPDAAVVSGYAKNAMLWATQKELITGIKSGGVINLSPRSNATRGQIATIIMRYLEAK